MRTILIERITAPRNFTAQALETIFNDQYHVYSAFTKTRKPQKSRLCFHIFCGTIVVQKYAMTRTDLDFLSEKDKLINQPRRRLSPVSKVILYALIIFVSGSIFFGASVITSGEHLSQTLGNSSLWGQLKHLISSGDRSLNGEEDDRINVLLLGMGGLDHDGPFLTDTMMVASFKPSTKQVALISLPRDLLVQIPGNGWRKINHANSFGEVENPGHGGELATEVVSQVLGIPIQYYVRIDFAGFKNIIDDLGGVTVDVENKLDDRMYPIKGKETATTSERYEHLVVEPGRRHMDGELALKYVRSRQAAGVEGSDFARSKRQQKVLTAVKEKALSLNTITNPYRISKLMETLSQHLATNMQVWEILRFYNLGKDIDETKITRIVFDDSPTGLLYAAITEEGAFVLKPKAGTFVELQTTARNVFDPAQAAKERIKKVEIMNGTKINGLAFETSQYLQSLGYEVIRIKNAPTQDYQKTVVYNLLTDDQDETAAKIADLIKAELAPTLPSWVRATSSPQVSSQTDVLIILGKDRKQQ